ncbi:MAG TPA: crosslink repair DNA glycosylase YcaQ family protein [Candidatus Limnocylindrales bacterium]|nr:crosslink repair DNA glycosylase YcaQ family protein [Candidatus Limnocylindrales bacterium]
MTLEIPLEVARRFILGKQGLWPGRRWRGLEGTEAAMRAIEQLQLDPLVLLARAHDLILHARVLDYHQDDWANLTYEQRRFFDWGGWLAVRPMDELPHWRVLMRRELDQPNWIAFQAQHGPAIAEMRAVLAERGTVSNREFAAGTRVRVDNYRGRKDSALALHFLWRIGDAMIHHRDGFERVYALTESIAPLELVYETDPEVADDYLMRKLVGADGLAPMRTVGNFMRRKVSPAELAAWRQSKLDAGELIDVRVEGWRTAQVALAIDEPLIRELLDGRTPAAWAPLDTTTDEEVTLLAPLDPVSARGRSKQLFGFEYVWEIYKPVEQRRFGPYTLPILWGDRLVGRFDARMDRSTSTLVINGLWLEDAGLARDDAFAHAWSGGLRRLATFLAARQIDANAVSDRKLRSATKVAARSEPS